MQVVLPKHDNRLLSSFREMMLLKGLEEARQGWEGERGVLVGGGAGDLFQVKVLLRNPVPLELQTSTQTMGPSSYFPERFQD